MNQSQDSFLLAEADMSVGILLGDFIAKGFEMVALARSERSLQTVKGLDAVPFAATYSMQGWSKE
jgi:hypothetical protein